MKLEGKVAIVTGSSRGIGKAIALELAREGADIVVAARTEMPGGPFPGTIQQTAQEIVALGRRAVPIRVDLTQEKDVETMVSQALSQLGQIDILINNAAINVRGTFLSIPLRRYDLSWSLNVRGAILCTKAVLPHMIGKKASSIINISSLAGFGADPTYYQTTVQPTSIIYAMTKAALNVFTVCLAQEVAEHNITVNAFLPGWTATEAVLSLSSKPDTSKMQSPQMWGKYAVLVAWSKLTGILFTEERLRQEFGPV
jgi:citronellol/citronellal dehydrogenase